MRSEGSCEAIKRGEIDNLGKFEFISYNKCEDILEDREMPTGQEDELRVWMMNSTS